MIRTALSMLFLFLSLSVVGQNLTVQEKLVLSAPMDKESLPRVLRIQNTDDDDAVLEKLVISGRQATDFHLKTAISFPLTIKPKESLELSFTFKPRDKPGIHSAILEIHSPDIREEFATVQLHGLAAQGVEGENEPSLFMILKTLGYKTFVGGEDLKLGITDTLLGDEIKASKFVAATDNKVELIPIARYSPAEQVPFGYYYVEDEQLKYGRIATLSAEYLQHQTIYPRLANGKTSFSPGKSSFGVFVSTSSHATYTDDSLNSGIPNASRVYPLKNTKGEPLENQYLICFEEAQNGDYQDFVFIISNVRPVPQP